MIPLIYADKIALIDAGLLQILIFAPLFISIFFWE